MVQVLSAAFAWAAARGKLPSNPAAKVQKLKRSQHVPPANRPWTHQERHIVLGSATGGVRVLLALGMFAAMRVGDALRFTWAGYDGETLRWRQGKTGDEVRLPVHRRLKAILDDARPLSSRASPLPVALSTRGQPFTEAGFRSSFFKLKLSLEAAGLIGPGLTFHGLRHTVATLLAEEGIDAASIAATLGHRSLVMAQWYSRAADNRRRAAAAIAALENATR